MRTVLYDHIETVPGAASAWFAIFYAVELFPTHISAIIGVLKMTHKDNLMVWLLATYGGVGALSPILIVADHVGTHTLRWPMSVIYSLVWVNLLISFAALSLAGVIGAYRTKQDHHAQRGAARTPTGLHAPRKVLSDRTWHNRRSPMGRRVHLTSRV